MCAREQEPRPLHQSFPTNTGTTGRRKKLWQLDAHFHCSVIGTCVTLDELRRICQKLKINVDARVSDYELHRGFVSLANEPSSPSRLLHKHLDRKYKRDIENITKIHSAESLNEVWKTSMQKGEIAGPYWALVTHPWVPKELLQHIYGEVHMLSHLAGASIRMDMQRFKQLQQRNKTLAKQLGETKAYSHRYYTDNLETQQALKTQLAKNKRMEIALEQTRSQLDCLKQTSRAQRLQTELDKLTAKLIEEKKRTHRSQTAVSQWQQVAQQAQAHTSELEAQLIEVRHERDALEKIYHRLPYKEPIDRCQAVENQVCPEKDLCGRCILYVGGRHSQCGQFRTLVEYHNGRFLHHDGGREDSRQRLATILSQADAVLCPLDCVSHDAVNRVKRFCQCAAKPLVLLPRASLSAFARGLEQLTTV